MKATRYSLICVALAVHSGSGKCVAAVSFTSPFGDPPVISDSLSILKTDPSDSLVILAPRPLIDSNATTIVRHVDQSFFTNIPSRGIPAAIALQPGVVVQGVDALGMPAVHMRGGRVDETGYSIEGVGVNDVLFGGRGLAVTAEALERLNVIAGGSSAGEGGGYPGMISMQLRSGDADRWSGSLISESDRFTGMNRSALGVYSYGYSDWTGTFGGPFPGLGKTLRLFGSVQNTFYRDPSLSVRSGWNFSGANAVVIDTVVSQFHPQAAKPDTLNLVFPGGNALGGQDNRWILTGTALLDLSPIQVRIAGSYSYDRSRTPTVLQDVFNQSRLPLNIERDGFFTVKFSHAVSSAVSYEASFNYFRKSFVTEDPQLQGNLFAYGDPAANAVLGYDLRMSGGVSTNWPAYSLWGGAFQVDEPGTQIAEYEKDEQQSLGGRAAMTLRLGDQEVNFGGEFSLFTIRRYAPSNVLGWYNLRNRYADPASLELALIQTGGDTYGYDIFGREINADVNRNAGGGYQSLFYTGPRHPVFASVYAQDEIRLQDITLSLGLRFDYVYPDSRDAYQTDVLFVDNNSMFLTSDFKQTESTLQVSPRFGLSFPFGDRNLVHAHYGKYVQQSELKDSYAGAGRMSYLIRADGFFTNTFGWGIQPVRVTQYEIGLTRQLNEFAAVDITAFYRETSDLVSIRLVNLSESYDYLSLENGGFASSKGLEFSFSLLRIRRIAAQINYTFQDLRGTESNPTDNAGAWWNGSIVQQPGYARPLNWNQPNRGSIVVDYRFGKDDGGDILEQMGLNLLMTFNSGHSFTILTEQQRGPAPTDPRYQIPAEPIGASTTPWFFELDGRIDKTFSWGTVNLDVFVYVINVLGTDNAVDVFPRTGDPSNDGWLQTPDGRVDAAGRGPQYVAFYDAVNDGKNSGNWGPPRQIRFGLRLEY